MKINKQSVMSGFFGGLLSFLLVSGGLVAAQNTTLFAGTPFSWTSNSDNDSAVIATNGSISFKPISVGPGFGSGLGGMAYRNTGEAAGDPAFVMRFNAYYFEDASNPSWLGILNSTGLCVGCNSSDSGTFPAYPQYKADVRGDMRLANTTDTFFRIGSKSSTTSVNIGYLFERAGTPVWAMGLLPGMCGTGANNDLVVCKYVSGTGWVRVASWPY